MPIRDPLQRRRQLHILFTPVATSGARIEYVDNWIGSNNGVSDNRTGSTFSNWTGDSGEWQPGLSVYYIHSKDIHKTGRSYFEDATSLILGPGERPDLPVQVLRCPRGRQHPAGERREPEQRL